MGAALPFVIALAGVIWLFELVKAKITRQPPPWETHERQPPTPLTRGMWMSDIEMPRAENPHVGKALLQVGLLYLALGAIATGAVLVTRAAGGSNDAEIAAAIITIATLMAVVVFATVIVGMRKSRRHF